MYLSNAPPLHLPDGGGDDEGDGSLLPLGGLLDWRLEEAGGLGCGHTPQRLLKGLEPHLAGENQIACNSCRQINQRVYPGTSKIGNSPLLGKGNRENEQEKGSRWKGNGKGKVISRCLLGGRKYEKEKEKQRKCEEKRKRKECGKV